jgi:hypothetical protein
MIDCTGPATDSTEMLKDLSRITMT